MGKKRGEAADADAFRVEGEEEAPKDEGKVDLGDGIALKRALDEAAIQARRCLPLPAAGCCWPVCTLAVPACCCCCCWGWHSSGCWAGASAPSCCRPPTDGGWRCVGAPPAAPLTAPSAFCCEPQAVADAGHIVDNRLTDLKIVLGFVA